MSFYKLNDELEHNDFKTVKKIQLGLLNPEEIRKGAVCEICNSETYEGGESRYPNTSYSFCLDAVPNIMLVLNSAGLNFWW